MYKFATDNIFKQIDMFFEELVVITDKNVRFFGYEQNGFDNGAPYFVYRTRSYTEILYICSI